MFPLKTLVVAAIIAIAFSPRVSACAMHQHDQTAAITAPAEATGPTVAETTAGPAAPTSTEAAAPQPTAVADAGQDGRPAAR